MVWWLLFFRFPVHKGKNSRASEGICASVRIEWIRFTDDSHDLTWAPGAVCAHCAVIRIVLSIITSRAFAGWHAKEGMLA